jgi:nicotinate phosphoribosyltransferase
MDHFAIQAAERPGMTRAESERHFFKAYQDTFPGVPTTMLIDTYDTERGIRHAVEATDRQLGAIRIDSNVSPESVQRACKLLAELGAPQTKIYVSDGLDEGRVEELRDLVDGFGIGENIVCSPDSAVGVGAVAKLVVNGYGAITMKVAKGTGKATLPGELQVWRYPDHDLVALQKEPAPGGGRAMLLPVWRGDSALAKDDAKTALNAARTVAKEEMDTLSPDLRAIAKGEAKRKLVASDALVLEIERLVSEVR